MRTLATLALIALAQLASAQDKPAWTEVTFPSADSLPITGELYRASDDKQTPFLLLCHQASWSRGEYREIAPRLVAMGFNCLAIDQRSGGVVNQVQNKTHAAAKAKGLGTTFLDARVDIVAALKHCRATYASGKLFVVGSSYSSALVLEIVGRDKALADGVISFAPGEYFRRFGKSGSFIKEGAAGLTCPVWITSSKREAPMWAAIYEAIGSEHKAKFIPETAGQHGARALWKMFPDSPAYWKALTAFLDKHAPRPKE